MEILVAIQSDTNTNRTGSFHHQWHQTHRSFADLNHRKLTLDRMQRIHFMTILKHFKLKWLPKLRKNYHIFDSRMDKTNYVYLSHQHSNAYGCNRPRKDKDKYWLVYFQKCMNHSKSIKQ